MNRMMVFSGGKRPPYSHLIFLNLEAIAKSSNHYWTNAPNVARSVGCSVSMASRVLNNGRWYETKTTWGGRRWYRMKKEMVSDVTI
jgi:hypothetical protein